MKPVKSHERQPSFLITSFDRESHCGKHPIPGIIIWPTVIIQKRKKLKREKNVGNSNVKE